MHYHDLDPHCVSNVNRAEEEKRDLMEEKERWKSSYEFCEQARKDIQVPPVQLHVAERPFGLQHVESGIAGIKDSGGGRAS